MTEDEAAVVGDVKNKRNKPHSPAVQNVKADQNDDSCHWSRLKRQVQSKSRKWFDTAHGNVVELILRRTTDSVLVICEDGTIHALKTGNAKETAATLEWQVAIDIPSFLGMETKHKKAELCHAAYDEKDDRLYFSLFPSELGVFYVVLSDLEASGRHLTEKMAEVNNIALTAGGNSRRRSSIINQTSLTAEQLQVLTGPRTSLRKIAEEFAPRGENGARLLKPFIGKTWLDDGMERWFFGLETAPNRLFACHRYRPESISIWSTEHDSDNYGQMLQEISSSTLLIGGDVPFQPFQCRILPDKTSKSTFYLAVLDSLHKLLVLKLTTMAQVDEEETMAVEVQQIIADQRGPADKQMQFPLSVHFSAKTGHLLLADGLNDRVQIFEKLATEYRWQHRWTSPVYLHTVVPNVGGVVTVSVNHDAHLGKNAKEKQPPTWVRCVVAPDDVTSGDPYLLLALNEREVVCLG